METVCTLCEEPLEGQPQMELLCHHRYHTQCFLTNVATAIHGGQDNLQCVVCHQHLFEQEEEENIYEEDEQTENETAVDSERTRLFQLWDNNAEFRADIKKYQQALRGSSQSFKTFKELLRAKKTELNTIYLPIKLHIEGLYSVHKEQIKQSQAHKDYSSALRKSVRYYTNLQQKYNMNSWSLSILREKRGCKRLQRPYHRWRSRPSWLIRRAIRLYVPW